MKKYLDVKLQTTLTEANTIKYGVSLGKDVLREVWKDRPVVSHMSRKIEVK